MKLQDKQLTKQDRQVDPKHSLDQSPEFLFFSSLLLTNNTSRYIFFFFFNVLVIAIPSERVGGAGQLPHTLANKHILMYSS